MTDLFVLLTVDNHIMSICADYGIAQKRKEILEQQGFKITKVEQYKLCDNAEMFFA